MKLREIRRSRGYSMIQLAKLAGMPNRTIQNIEKRGTSTVSNAIKLATVLDVTLDELCGYTKKSL